MSIFDIQEPVQPQHLSTIALEIAIDSYPLVAWPWLVFGRKMENAESYNLEIQKFNPLAALQPVASHRFNQGISVIGDDRVFYILVPQIQTDRLVYDYTSALVDLYALDPDSAQNEPQKIKTLVLPHHSTRVLQQNIIIEDKEQMTLYTTSKPLSPKLKAVVPGIGQPFILHKNWGYARKNDQSLAIFYLNDIEEPVVAANSTSARLYQNYPNPFNQSTRIFYRVAQSGQVKIVVYNSLGQKIKTLVDVLQNSGHHIAVWDGRDSNGTLCAAGIYFIRATIGQRHFNKKMLYIP